MKKEDPPPLNPQEEVSMEAMLERYGSLWADSSVPDSVDQTEKFRKKLADRINVEKSTSPRSGWFWIPGWVLAGATCVVAAFLLSLYSGNSVGGIVFLAGDVWVNEGPAQPSGLKSGTEVKVSEGGEAMLSMDGTRVDLFLREETEVSIDSLDRVTLARGDLWVRIDPNSGPFKIVTPEGSVKVHGTTFGVTTREGETLVEIASGEVSVQSSVGTEFITPGTGAKIVGLNQPPIVHPSTDDVTPRWAKDIFEGAAKAQAEKFFPSAAP